MQLRLSRGVQAARRAVRPQGPELLLLPQHEQRHHHLPQQRLHLPYVPALSRRRSPAHAILQDAPSASPFQTMAAADPASTSSATWRAVVPYVLLPPRSSHLLTPLSSNRPETFAQKTTRVVGRPTAMLDPAASVRSALPLPRASSLLTPALSRRLPRRNNSKPRRFSALLRLGVVSY